jgi:hypothetical protein
MCVKPCYSYIMGNIVSSPKRIWRAVFQSTEPDFEKILADLNDSISKLQIEVQDLQQKKQQWTSFLWMFHGGIYLAFWSGYYLWLRYPSMAKVFVPGLATWTASKSSTWSGVWPILLLFVIYPLWTITIMKLVSYYYQFQLKQKESLLKVYKSKQKLELEALKKKTKFYQTQALLQRYESTPTKPHGAGDPALRQTPIVSGVKGAIKDNGSNVQQRGSNVYQNRQNLKDLNVSISSKDQLQNPQSMKASSWSDRLVDAILLPDSSENQRPSPLPRDIPANISVPSVKQSPDTPPLFALICAYCYNHNGFLPEREYDTLPCYICPKCGKLNVKGEDPEKSHDHLPINHSGTIKDSPIKDEQNQDIKVSE